MSIKIENLTKIYGQQRAVDAISFEVGEGEIVGFLGPNGAGKSTTMKIATCFLPPSEGTVEVAGYDVTTHSLEVRKNVGYLPEHNPLYLDMFVHEYLAFIGGLHGMRGKSLKDRVKEMISMCGLTVEQNKKIGALSKGYRQRVGLAQAIIHDPKVLILDEPTTGLDPNQIVEIRNLIKKLGSEKTVIFSTHIMQEVQALCDRAVIINKGSIVADGKLSDLQGGGKEVIIHVVFESDVPVADLQSIEGVLAVEVQAKGSFNIKVQPGEDVRSKIVKKAAEKDWALVELKQETFSLENVFQQLTQEQKHV